MPTSCESLSQLARASFVPPPRHRGPQEPPLTPCVFIIFCARSKTPSPRSQHGIVVATAKFVKLSGHARAVVRDSIDRAVVVVGDQHRAVLEDHEVSRASDIIVVFNEARDERIDGS